MVVEVVVVVVQCSEFLLHVLTATYIPKFIQRPWVTNLIVLNLDKFSCGLLNLAKFSKPLYY